MHRAKPLSFGKFQGCDDPIAGPGSQPRSNQLNYLACYLKGLHAQRYILEPNYFDLDYLEEFSSFYSLNTRGYSNLCRRVHYFSNDAVDQEMLRRALADEKDAVRCMRDSYLGFSVLRPIPHSIGKTVFRWYEDQTPNQQRVTEPSRQYDCHIAGFKLSVTGIAWQQQDSAVASCATVGVWSMLHSSAFDYRHSVPTTTQITLAANNSVKLGRSTFPSVGLQIEQLLEAIKHHRLNPIQIDGDMFVNGRTCFSKEKFASTCAAFIRSGYPVLLVGNYAAHMAEGHVVCMTGFRDSPVPPPPNTPVAVMDEKVDCFYLHDDNYGPNIRFKVCSAPKSVSGGKSLCQIKSEPPSYVGSSGAFPLPIEFIPSSAIVATHQELRLSASRFYAEGYEVTRAFHSALNHFLKQVNLSTVGLSFGCRFMLLKTYLATELGNQISNKNTLSAVRLSLQEKVPPMSLHIGILRIAGFSGSPLLDIIYDTTEATPVRGPYCHIAFEPVESVTSTVALLSRSTVIRGY